MQGSVKISAFTLKQNIVMSGDGSDIGRLEAVARLCPWTESPSYPADNSPDRYLHYLDYNVGIEKAFREVLCSAVISLRSYGCMC